MSLTECFGIIEDECQIASTTSSRHLPSQYAIHRGILVDVVLNTWLNHGWEHGNLSFERGFVGFGKGFEVELHDGFPTIVGSFGKRPYLQLCDVLAFYY